MAVSFVKTQLQHVIKTSGLDENGDGKISKAEMMEILKNKEACTALGEVKVDVVGLVDNIDQIFEGDDDEEATESLGFERLMKVVLDLRGSNLATVRDIVDLRKFFKASQQKMRDELRSSMAQMSPRSTSPVGRASLRRRNSACLGVLGSMRSSTSLPAESSDRSSFMSDFADPRSGRRGRQSLSGETGGSRPVQREPAPRMSQPVVDHFPQAPQEKLQLHEQRKALVEALAAVQQKATSFMESLPSNEDGSSGSPLGCTGGPEDSPDSRRIQELHEKMCELQDRLGDGARSLGKARFWMQPNSSFDSGSKSMFGGSLEDTDMYLVAVPRNRQK